MVEKPLLVIVGPTASGKTALSLRLAQERDGEIISADSRLFYRGMDIGTAKPSKKEQAIVPHYMIDVCAPNETISLAEYQRAAYRLIDQIHERGKLPILVGGTGQYVRAIIEGWGIPEVPPQPEMRLLLEQLGAPEVARWLAYLDPIAAEKIHPNNMRRGIRALEVVFRSGQPISKLQEKNPPDYQIEMIGLHCERELLYQRVDQRVDLMIEAGLVAEMEQLIAAGYGEELPAMSGLGYKQLWPYMKGECSLAEAIERIKFETHRFARYQYTWFRLDDPKIEWMMVDQSA